MSEEKKIIIDEDWKTRVQSERENLEKNRDSAPKQPPPGGLPEASFGVLLTTLATEAMVALGQIPHPATGKAKVDRDQAKYIIDLLQVLKDKTRGNLTDEEDHGLIDVLHQLRMAFIAVPDRPSEDVGATAE